ncbi:MAG: hypothetical protein AAGK97_15480 [Bacteroidota bacterium]
MKSIRPIYTLIIAVVIILSACKRDKGKNIPDVSDIDIALEVFRTEELIFTGDSLTMDKIVENFIQSFPVFSDIYFQRILGYTKERLDSTTLSEELLKMKADSGIQFLLNTTKTEFEDFDLTREELEEGLKYYNYYFPERGLPAIYTLISEYAHQVFIFSEANGRDAVGIGLDMFLGDDFNYKEIAPSNPSFSEYLSRTFNKAHLSRKVMEVLVDDLMPPITGNKLLDHMIHNGKKLYILERLIPNAPDSILHEYTQDQMNWVNNNEKDIWVHLLHENLIYSDKNREYFKLINPSPTSYGMPAPSPGRTANWMGYKIVSKFMASNKDLSLQELLSIKDAQFLLEESKYKPPR